jgi:hypothetical protein
VDSRSMAGSGNVWGCSSNQVYIFSNLVVEYEVSIEFLYRYGFGDPTELYLFVSWHHRLFIVLLIQTLFPFWALFFWPYENNSKLGVGGTQENHVRPAWTTKKQSRQQQKCNNRVVCISVNEIIH